MKRSIFFSIIFSFILTSHVAAYTAQKGDTLGKIANMFGTTWQEIWEENPQIYNPNLIFVGQEIRIGQEQPTLGINILPTDNYDSFLTAPLGSSATTTFVNDLPDGITSTVYTLFGSDGVTPREKIYCTGKSTGPNRLTGCTRGVSFSPVNGVIDETAGTGLSHSKNTRIAITDNINFSGKAIAILNGSQYTDADVFRVGTGTTTGNDPCIAWDDGSDATSTIICKNVATDMLYWSVDGGANTYNFTSTTFNVLSASTTRAIGIQNSEIFVRASTTLGYTFDENGELYRTVSTTTGIEADSTGLKLNITTIDSLIASSTPTTSTIVKSEADGKINSGWIDTTDSSFVPFLSARTLYVTTTDYVETDDDGVTTTVATTTFDAGEFTTSTMIRIKLNVTDWDNSSSASATNIALKIGTTVIALIGPITPDTTITNAKGDIEGLIYSGGDNAQDAFLRFSAGGDLVDFTGTAANYGVRVHTAATSAIDTSAGGTVSIDVWSSNVGGTNTFTVGNGSIELLKQE